MSATLPAADAPGSAGTVAAPDAPLSPNRRAWARFRRNRLGYLSLWAFGILLVVATLAELVSNDRPFVAKVNGEWHFPAVSNPPEVRLGGDFLTPTDWKDYFENIGKENSDKRGSIPAQWKYRS